VEAAVTVQLRALIASAALAFSFAPPPLTVTHVARALAPGELVVLTIVTAEPATGVTVNDFDKTFLAYKVDARTWKALVGIDLDVKPGAYDVTVDAESPAPAHALHRLVVRPKAFPTRKLVVDNAYVEPPPKAQEQIDQDTRDLALVWSSSAGERFWARGFVRPVPDSANSAFGSRSVFNGQARSPHGGADFNSPAGRTILSPNAGRVALARELYFTGNTVIIDHGLGLFSMLAHMSQIGVHEGDTVTAGQVLGKVGATGRVTGPHLHWAVRLNGTRVDPLSLLALLGDGRK
jgi:murein DD-endopeptidase MepM/ murein hydrolase activator NlpD